MASSESACLAIPLSVPLSESEPERSRRGQPRAQLGLRRMRPPLSRPSARLARVPRGERRLSVSRRGRVLLRQLRNARIRRLVARARVSKSSSSLSDVTASSRRFRSHPIEILSNRFSTSQIPGSSNRSSHRNLPVLPLPRPPAGTAPRPPLMLGGRGAGQIRNEGPGFRRLGGAAARGSAARVQTLGKERLLDLPSRASATLSCG